MKVKIQIESSVLEFLFLMLYIKIILKKLPRVHLTELSTV